MWPEPGRHFMGAACHPLGLCSGDPGPMMRPTRVGSKFPTLEEPPFMIEKGMVFAIEGGVWDWDGKKWAYDGVKLENVGVVTDTGCEILYRFPYKDLIAVGLPGVY